MDVDPHANPKESALKIPLPATKYKFQVHFSEEEVEEATKPLLGACGDGSEYLHDTVKFLKKKLVCLLEGTNSVDMNTLPKQGFSIESLAKMFTQIMQNKVDDDVVMMTVGEDTLPKMKILIVRMAYTSPMTLWPGQVKNGTIPPTQEGRYWAAAVAALGSYYKPSKKNFTQTKLSWAATVAKPAGNTPPPSASAPTQEKQKSKSNEDSNEDSKQPPSDEKAQATNPTKAAAQLNFVTREKIYTLPENEARLLFKNTVNVPANKSPNAVEYQSHQRLPCSS